MKLSYTYWSAKEGGYIGFLNQYPNHWTQGESIEELESMLSSLYDDIIQFDDIQSAVPEHTGLLAVAV
ncbi:MAG: type II toxin-antitoxin system HicB family antitoxin [Treponema sp.]|nr:type II toxin-antitoxin system HicB family antitoxin [Treponema sp.]